MKTNFNSTEKPQWIKVFLLIYCQKVTDNKLIEKFKLSKNIGAKNFIELLLLIILNNIQIIRDWIHIPLLFSNNN